MSSDGQLVDYEPVTPTRRGGDAEREELLPASFRVGNDEEERRGASVVGVNSPLAINTDETAPDDAGRRGLKRGHAFTFAGLFLFTVFLYFRPYEFLPLPNNITFVLALLTLAVFVPSQLAAEGNLTARPREVNLVLLLCLTAVLSIPLALNPSEGWETFSGLLLKVVIIFVVMVNVVRTERRLQVLIFLSLAVGCYLGLGALNDYRMGNFAAEGYRVKGRIGGMFDNPNDMATHLVTMIPLAVTLLLATRRILKKLFYAMGAGVMAAGVVVTFSRAAFLGLMLSGAALALKLGRRNRLAVIALILVAAVGFLALAPGYYAERVLSIFDNSLDPNNSSTLRREILMRSIYTAIRNPAFGIGIGNFHIVSVSELVSHNAYTQVAAEMGLAAFVIYLMFMLYPLRRLRQIERETFGDKQRARFYYLSVGLQASLVAYMVCSFFASVAYLWYVYYLVGYAVCLRRMYEAETGAPVLLDSERKAEEKRRERRLRLAAGQSHTVTT